MSSDQSKHQTFVNVEAKTKTTCLQGFEEGAVCMCMWVDERVTSEEGGDRGESVCDDCTDGPRNL